MREKSAKGRYMDMKIIEMSKFVRELDKYKDMKFSTQFQPNMIKNAVK